MDSSEISLVIEKECKLDPKSPTLVGVSGGPDSLCLLHILQHSGYSVIAGHINHQLRETADRDEARVEEICRQWKIPLIICRVDVRSFAQHSHFSIEESARILRYQTLMRVATEHSAQALAVAHQAGDQTETMLMHLLRGAGMAGLKGMQYRSLNPVFSITIPIVRPLLEVSRAEIEAYCSKNQIVPCQDETNSDTQYFRNRIRHELIPMLESYNPQMKRHLVQTGQLLAEENRFLEEEAQHVQKKVLLHQGEGFFLLEREGFLNQDIVLQRRILRGLLVALRGEIRDISFSVIEEGLSFSREQNAPLAKSLLKSLFMAFDQEHNLLIYRSDADLADLWPWLSAEPMLFTASDKMIRLNQHWQIHGEILAPREFASALNPREACFDADSLMGQLKLTYASAGDHFAPFGMKGREIKLGDYFTNQHLPVLARRNWPILRGEGQILWVVGQRQAEFARVTEDTRRILKLSLLKID
jgi:tRNA(Ile)-lysidine synthase